MDKNVEEEECLRPCKRDNGNDKDDTLVSHS